jgi:microcystin-dependent protein
VPGFLAPFLKFREDDSNGKPLAGGRLYSYAAGTSTPLATYFNQDLAAGHENTNPVILDASGRANVWIQDGVGYKFVLKDALDNTIYTQDNVQIGASTAAPPSGGGGGGGGTQPVAQQVPSGSIFPYAGSTAPQDYLLCDGAAVSRSTYAALFAVCGTTYGAGNNSTTFNLPNLQQRFPLGKSVGGTGATLGGVGGTIDHVHTGASHQHTIPTHAHTVPAHTHLVPRDNWGSEQQFSPAAPLGRLATFPGNYDYLATTDNVTSSLPATATDAKSLTTDPAGTGNTGVANPPFLTVNFIIKT